MSRNPIRNMHYPQPWYVKWPKDRSVRRRQRKQYYIPVEATNLLLDLDSENSPFVRPFDENIDGRPMSVRDHILQQREPVQKLVRKLEASNKSYETNWNHTKKDKFSNWRITDYDILSVALRGAPNIKHSHHDYVISETNIYDRNSIPYYILHSPSKTIAYMLQRQKMANSRELTRDDLNGFRSAILQCRSVIQVEQKITNMVRTPTGRWLVSHSTDVIGKACLDKAPASASKKMIAFLNNLFVVLEGEKAEISPFLLRCAIRAATQCAAPDMVQKYIVMGRGSNLDLDTKELLDIFYMLGRCMDQLAEDTTSSYFSKNPTYLMLSIYGLLTGQRLGDSERQPSLRDLIPHDAMQEQYHKLSLSLLARLGAFRTIWHIWYTQSTAPQGEDVNVFASALFEALSGNHNLAKLAQAPGFTRVVGSYPDDCQLDMERIIESVGLIEQAQDGNQYHALDYAAFKEMFGRGSIEESMLALQQYLLSGIKPNDKS
ncbi:hypothetical protein F5Y11DRAFT_308417 [Daldinia sp. FL1419]|nr:hypothetical protein F5Y11DRAFT_308417 [Daldinia sp. FL1419]